jgi:hypothetical protein
MDIPGHAQAGMSGMFHNSTRDLSFSQPCLALDFALSLSIVAAKACSTVQDSTFIIIVLVTGTSLHGLNGAERCKRHNRPI